MFIILIFFFIILLYFYPVFSASYIFIERDLSPFFIPPRNLWVNLVKSFELPLWNSYTYSGIPLLATLQPGVFYPPHIFYLFLPFNIAWNWLIILHFVFAGCTTYLFLRHLKASSIASFVGGVIFALSGYLLSVHNLLPHLLAVPWFPLVIMYFLKYLENKKSKHIVFTGIFLTMEFLAGAPEIVMMTFLVLCIISFFPGVFVTEKVGVSLRLKGLILTGLIFFLLSAVQLLPFYELKAWSIRYAGLSYQEATNWSFAWKDFIQFFLPDAFGYFKTPEKYWANQSWLKTVYLGIIPFVLSIFFFISSKDRRKWIFLSLMFISFIFALGRNTPVYHFLHHIPPFNSIRYPVKFLFLFFFMVAVTSGLGLDRLREGIKNKDRITKIIVNIVFYLGFLFAALWGYLYLFDADIYVFLDKNGFKPEAYNDIWFNLHNAKRFLFFSFVACTLMLVYLKISYKRLALFGIVFILIADLFLANYGFYRTIQWNQYISQSKFEKALAKNIETERYFLTRKTAKNFEFFPLDRAVMSSAYAPLFRLYTIEGSEVMRIKYHEIFLLIMNSTHSISDAKRFFDISGVRHVITSYKVSDNDLKLVKSIEIADKTAYLYEYTQYPGRFLLFSIVSFVKDDQTVIEKLQSDTFDGKRELILIGNKEAVYENKDLRGHVKLVSYKANRFSLEYETSNDAFLYVSDTYYPGWRAYVDGKETNIYRANLAFRAIEVPKGKHTVVFKYIPMSFYIGLVLTIIGILLCIWLWRRDNGKLPITKHQ
ncbi:MAG: YfhO family protein [Proteobacteria bacterium]|nr:YfhO family protein [Pseudomonadota bacterium]